VKIFKRKLFYFIGSLLLFQSCNQTILDKEIEVEQTYEKNDVLIKALMEELKNFGDFNTTVNESTLKTQKLNWNECIKIYNVGGKAEHIYVPFTKNKQSLGFLDIKLTEENKPIEVQIKGYYDSRNILYDSIEHYLQKKGFLLKELSFPETRLKVFAKNTVLTDYLKNQQENFREKKMSNGSAPLACVYEVTGLYLGNFNLDPMQCTPDVINRIIPESIVAQLNSELADVGGHANISWGQNISINVPQVSMSHIDVANRVRAAASRVQGTVQCVNSFNIIELNVGGGCATGGGGSTGGGGGDDVGSRVKHQLDDYPCAVGLIDYFTQSESKLSQLLNSLFGGNQTRINLTFHAKDYTNPLQDGGLRGGQGIHPNNAHVDLSKFILQNSTQEYLLTTMYHEVWHAYLEAEKYRLGASQFNTRYPEIQYYQSPDGSKYLYRNDGMHSRFDAFMGLMKAELKAFNPNLSDDVIDALTTAGIIENRLPNDIILNQNERDVTKNKNKGQKCP
jgi:hypothetical protein